jgi:glycine/D-amino acid oxidase-like deaminating enzyme
MDSLQLKMEDSSSPIMGRLALSPDEPASCLPIRKKNSAPSCGTFPALADAPVSSIACVHTADSWDGNFWIDHDPDRPGLFVATGDSGHAFKFTPVLGKLIADALERETNQFTNKFAWRTRGNLTKEDARFSGDVKS